MVGTVNFTNQGGTINGLNIGDHGQVKVAVSSAERERKVDELTIQLLQIVEERLATAPAGEAQRQIRSDAHALVDAAKAGAKAESAGPKVRSLGERLTASMKKVSDTHEGLTTCLSALVSLWPVAAAAATTLGHTLAG